ncbi:hypothetical protein T492DRAFT_1115914, partial [Pavlovales sp. CCMP2436]
MALASLLAPLGERAIVRHRVLPGWTAFSTVRLVNNPATGLVGALRAIQSPSVSIAVIPAGTNDLGYSATKEEIVSGVTELHARAHADGVATIALSIPSSAWQAQDASAAALAEATKKRCAELGTLCTFAEFPLAFERNELWSPDGLHLSAHGYRAVGERIAPAVASALRNLSSA